MDSIQYINQWRGDSFNIKCHPEKDTKSSSLFVSGGIGCSTQEKTTSSLGHGGSRHLHKGSFRVGGDGHLSRKAPKLVNFDA